MKRRPPLRRNTVPTPAVTAATTTVDTGIVEARSEWADARSRFLGNKAAVFGLCILAIVLVFAVFGQLIAGWTQAGEAQSGVGRGGAFGRDLIAQSAQGIRMSLTVGILGTLIAVVVGTLWGTMAGYNGGRTDRVMMRIVEVLMSIPFALLLILALVILGWPTLVLVIGIGLISWFDLARAVRAQTVLIKNNEFVEAAIATGVSDRMILKRHIIPNLLGVVIVYASLLVPTIIVLEGFIGFLGLGAEAPNASLGAVISAGTGQIQSGAWWPLVLPLSCFVATISAFYLIGDGLRDALDPEGR